MYTKNNILTFSLGFFFQSVPLYFGSEITPSLQQGKFFPPSKILAGHCEIEINDFSKIIEINLAY